jgi:hypothetical protein
MRFKATIAVIVLVVATACIRVDSSGGSSLASEGYSLSDPAKQERLKQELTAAGVPFTTKTLDGQEFVHWDASHAERANAVRVALLGPDLPSGRHISYDAETQTRFKSWLTENGIPFSTAVKEGREYVIWEENVDDKVRKWHLPLPPSR